MMTAWQLWRITHHLRHSIYSRQISLMMDSAICKVKEKLTNYVNKEIWTLKGSWLFKVAWKSFYSFFGISIFYLHKACFVSFLCFVFPFTFVHLAVLTYFNLNNYHFCPANYSLLHLSEADTCIFCITVSLKSASL